jgi:pantoate--beta-alanine ligase
MQIVHEIKQAREIIKKLRNTGKTIGLVPTMGALHEGHLSLVSSCRRECDFVVVSIFVNPTQFGPSEDLAQYPRPFETDCQLCQEQGVDLIFAPSAEEMYPQEQLVWVDVEKLGEHLCGASRPGHFRGVCTVVAKLFNIITPDFAYFGQKDAQQLAIIKRMVRDLAVNLEIRSCPTVREPDGLARSSRNRYLNQNERKQALCLYQALKTAEQLVGSGENDAMVLTAAMKTVIREQSSARIDYISIVDKELLQPIQKIDSPVLIALAVYIGSTRLIDNILVDPTEKSL